jgi:hypothetical protein
MFDAAHQSMRGIVVTLGIFIRELRQ